MRRTSLMTTLALVPCAIVNGFQQATYAPIRQRLDVGFELHSSAVETDAETENAMDTAAASQSELPAVIQGFVDERAEFNIALGRAMDTLRRDYPKILFREPDYSIYHKNINVVDPSGVQFSGLKNYKASFTFFQSFVKFLYCEQRSTIQMRMVPDTVLSSIRISWNVKLVPKLIGKPLYIDGVSMYHLDSKTKKIDEHRIDQLYINRNPLMPPYGILSLIMQEEIAKQNAGRVPVGVW